uniref:Uncharacterized protein n=1 Tax=Anguilla anguilla TaxID=7936 RepID=A0A0E9WY64_ANGAN
MTETHNSTPQPKPHIALRSLQQHTEKRKAYDKHFFITHIQIQITPTPPLHKCFFFPKDN